MASENSWRPEAATHTEIGTHPLPCPADPQVLACCQRKRLAGLQWSVRTHHLKGSAVNYGRNGAIRSQSWPREADFQGRCIWCISYEGIADTQCLPVRGTANRHTKSTAPRPAEINK